MNTLTVVAFIVAILSWLFPQPALLRLARLLKDLYSSRSQKKLAERIGRLEEQLNSSQQAAWTFTPAEWSSYQAIRDVARNQFNFEMNIYIYTLLLLTLLKPGYIPSLHFPDQAFMYTVLSVTMLFVIVLNQIGHFYEGQQQRATSVMHSTSGREALCDQIERLKMKQRH